MDHLAQNCVLNLVNRRIGPMLRVRLHNNEDDSSPALLIIRQDCSAIPVWLFGGCLYPFYDYAFLQASVEEEVVEHPEHVSKVEVSLEYLPTVATNRGDILF